MGRSQVVRAGAGPAGHPRGAAGRADLVLAGGRVIDPETGLDAVRNVGIRGGKIAAISGRGLRGKAVVDVTGHVVCPGFIDLNCHGQDLENDRLQALDGVTTSLQTETGVEDVAAWYAAQEGERLLHHGAGTSHVWARRVVLGRREEKKVATPRQIARMAGFLAENLAAGALGVGFGLEYQPLSTRWEVLEMFRVAGEHGACCFVHTRYGTLLEEQSNFTAVAEAFTAAQAAAAPLHILHVPSMALSNTKRVLKLIERLRERHDVTCDFYPYTAFGTEISSEVFAPGWEERFGIGPGDLEWAATHERLTPESFEAYRKHGGFVIAHAIPGSAVEAAVRSPATMVASDGGVQGGVGHPRTAGTFARVLGRYVREEGLISLGCAIEKMTLWPARRMEGRCPAFRAKGRLQVGMDADITVFDPAAVIDRATFAEPALPSAGLPFVLVGGTPVVFEGEIVPGVRPGRGLRAWGGAARGGVRETTARTRGQEAQR